MAASPSAWTIEAAMALAAEEPAATTLAARRRIEDQLAPPPAQGPQRKEWEAALDERLRRLAVKIAPGMSVAQGSEWRTVMVEALSDLPAMVSLTAAKRAIHRPMQFLNEIEGVVRGIAADMIERRSLALKRLDALRAEIERAREPALPPPVQEPWTEARIAEANAVFRQLGITTRYRLRDGECEAYQATGAEGEIERRAAGTHQIGDLLDTIGEAA